METAMDTKRLPGHIEFWDDERSIGNGIIVTLQLGFSFTLGEHEGVWGFDTVAEARRGSARKNVYPCRCDICKQVLPQ